MGSILRSAMVVVAGMALASVGCGGTPDTSGSGGSAAGGSSSGGTGPSGGATAAGGETASGGAVSSGGSLGTGGGTGGSGGLVPADLYPLALGNSWTWVIVSEETDDTCDDAYLTEAIYAAGNVDGREALVLSSACLPQQLETDSRMAVFEQQITQWIDEEWQITLAAPVSTGYTWTIVYTGNPGDYRWVATGDVTVPAGTFHDCWTRERVADDTTEAGEKTYCPGVGPVRQAYADLTLELASYDVQ